ncbi:GNAT family N-acetyltransferase [Streptomyces sp. NPDC094038]|uniref:GNAT family N-acetyltransferase n=1 Tax=Streptomyces sp. NPDC094038 TaxID=3366055 RepID=UPI00380C82BB
MRHFVTWARENTASHRRMVMVRDEVIIGMAWPAVLPRVPSPHAPHRASGDLQCVYVVPGERDGGLGGRLVDAVLERARELGLERVTVHSSPRATPACSRHGFESSSRLLHAHVARTTACPPTDAPHPADRSKRQGGGAWQSGVGRAGVPRPTGQGVSGG